MAAKTTNQLRQVYEVRQGVIDIKVVDAIVAVNADAA
jgi:hypothetical protein